MCLSTQKGGVRDLPSTSTLPEANEQWQPATREKLRNGQNSKNVVRPSDNQIPIRNNHEVLGDEQWTAVLPEQSVVNKMEQ